ncbi:MAG TPA: M20/M25/M40 family metallo-hydrolase [Pyrinomonadaceae bacterium]|nr:M20/M25/M40 family metallo-hydrolase [Pyrinomonadaceae bacterium]
MFPSDGRPRRAAPTIAFAVFVAISTLLVLYQQTPPRPVGANAPADVFSSGRAMESLKTIAQKPHPIGSPEHEAVRAFVLQQLTALGLQTEVQTTAGRGIVNERPASVAVNNIIAILKGNGSGRALLLAAHYDTVPVSPGASDDGAGVATLLETARALKSGPPLRNDLIFLFSDGEETGLLGAQAFLQHPLSKQVALALNFEARGASGPSVLFETSDNNAWLIDEFAAAAPYPNGNSVAYEVYRLMPNSTDLQVFKEAGIAGLNFAYFDGVNRYHSNSDDLQNISEASLQHHGTYALALARRFGNASLDTPSNDNAVYFDLLGKRLVHYSTRWVLPATVLIAIIFAAIAWFGARRGKITLPGVALGFLSFVAAVFAALGFGLLAWGFIDFTFSRKANPGGVYFVAFVLLTGVIAIFLYRRSFRKATIENLALGALAGWLLLLVIASLAAPGSSYLFFWPLVFCLAARLIMFRAETTTVTLFTLQLLFVLPAVVLLVPMAYSIFVALGFPAVMIVAPMLMLLFGLLIPQFACVTRLK